MEQDGRQARGQTRKLLILDAAVGVIAQEGAGNLTHRAAALAAKVSLASVTYHYPSIEAFRCAVFDHAGSRIGMAFRALIEREDVTVDAIPAIMADFAVSLVGQHRQDTVAVFEMIVATVHNPELRPVITFLDHRLAELLTPYVGEHSRALTVVAGIQGVILTALALGTTAAQLHQSTLELITRSRQSPDKPASQTGLITRGQI